MKIFALDNDILIKGAHYLLLLEIQAAISARLRECGILGAARFVVFKAVEKHELAGAHFAKHFPSFLVLEPNVIERTIAAEIELEAQNKGLSLDPGESLLCAIIETRKFTGLVSGDKRAIVAFEALATNSKMIAHLKNRVLCLEQIFSRILASANPSIVRDHVCSRPEVDKALTISFRCASKSGDSHEWREGLRSYIENLRADAPSILAS